MKKILCLVLSFVMLFAVSCSAKTSSDTSESSSEEPAKYEFQIAPYSEYWRDNYDPEMEESFKSYCEAVSKGETEFTCTYRSMTAVTDFKMLAYELMPIAAHYATITSISPDEQIAHIDYGMSQEDFLEKYNDFKYHITDIINTTCKPEYTDLEKSLALYDYLANNCEFDKSNKPHSSYEVLTDGIGICQDIAPAYNFLLAQVSIEALTCCSMFHAWSMVKIDGSYYHVDPTFILNEPNTLRYFGMTDDKREESVDVDKNTWGYSFYHFEDKDGKYKATNDFFLPLDDSQDYEIDYENDVISYVSRSTGEKMTFEY